jgi:hypothetical protein
MERCFGPGGLDGHWPHLLRLEKCGLGVGHWRYLLGRCRLLGSVALGHRVCGDCKDFDRVSLQLRVRKQTGEAEKIIVTTNL